MLFSMDQALALFLVLLWVAVATYADTQFKDAPGFLSVEFARGAVGYGATSFIAVATFKSQSWGWIFIVWSAAALALGLGLSVVLYHEPMTWRRITAASLLLMALVLAE
jgi:multidrug transporter EmrE-like cation transporter